MAVTTNVHYRSGSKDTDASVWNAYWERVALYCIRWSQYLKCYVKCLPVACFATIAVCHCGSAPLFFWCSAVWVLSFQNSAWKSTNCCKILSSKQPTLVPPVKQSTVGSHAFMVAGPKTWNALPEDVISSQSIHLSPPAQNVAFQFSSDMDCILTFSLGLSVPTVRRFCRFDMMWYDMIWHDWYGMRSCVSNDCKCYFRCLSVSYTEINHTPHMLLSIAYSNSCTFNVCSIKMEYNIHVDTGNDSSVWVYNVIVTKQ